MEKINIDRKMTRAEQFARKLYTPWSEDGMSRKDNTEVIEACIKGYEQAEKDLALTGEDILNISKILHQLEAEDWCSELIFDEAARIFNEQREKK